MTQHPQGPVYRVGGVDEPGGGRVTTDRIEVYKATDGWRWRRQAANGEVISQGESHTRREDAVRAARRANPEDLEYQVESDG